MTTVAVVDDSEIELDILQANLLEHDIACIGISQSEAALDIIRNTLPDLVVLDVHMPKLDGLALCKQLRLNPETREIPIIMLSGDNSAETIIASLHLGVIDYIPKPCAMKHIVDVVRQHDIINKFKQAWQPAKTELERIIYKYGGHNVHVQPTERREVAGGRRATDTGAGTCANYKPH